MHMIISEYRNETLYLRFDPDAAQEYWFSKESGDVYATRETAEQATVDFKKWVSDYTIDGCPANFGMTAVAALLMKVVHFGVIG